MHERRGDPCLYERVRASGQEQTKMRERCSSFETDEKLKREKETDNGTTTASAAAGGTAQRL